MLTLTRRVGERIVIGDTVEVEVVQIQGGRVRLGIRAPRALPVYRGELVDRIKGENMKARGAAPEVAAVTATSNVPIIRFSRGLFGMPDLTEWVICELAEPIEGAPPEETAAVRVMVAVADSSIRLLVIDLCAIDPSYPVEHACAAAGFSTRDVAIAGVVTAPADGSAPTVNTMAPVVIDMATREAVQVILTDESLSVTESLTPNAGKEVACL